MIILVEEEDGSEKKIHTQVGHLRKKGGGASN